MGIGRTTLERLVEKTTSSLKNNTSVLGENIAEQSPAEIFTDITPNDVNELSIIPRSIYIGGEGNVTVVDTNDNEVTFSGISAGSILPIRPKIVKSTGTTATNIIALN